MRRIAPVLAVVATALALVMAGCGGGGGGALSKEDYSAKVASVGDTLGQSFESLASEANSMSSGEITTGDDLTRLTQGLADAAQTGIDALDDAADELEAADPPEDAQVANDELVEGLRALAGDFEDLVDALESRDLVQVLDIAAALQDIGSSEAGQSIQQAIDELQAMGFDVEGEG